MNLTPATPDTTLRSAASGPPALRADEVRPTLEQHVLLDGLRIVVDLDQSRGSELVEADTGRRLLDLFGFYGSLPVGFNHPHFGRLDVIADLLRAAQTKVANSDVLSVPYASFVETFHRVAGLPPLGRYFFIEGGAAAVENALKAAMDWKVRRNLAAGRGERGTEIVHFTRAFHGRSGYTLSLTNTDPRKTDYFAKFNWPRVPAPSIDFALSDLDRADAAAAAERLAEHHLREHVARRGADLAAIILEPVQGEGGDNHFRPEWFRFLRRFCDEHDLPLIFDEVQSGLGITGRMWCCEHFGVVPDLLVFGKKTQVCGVMAGPRLDEVPENVFRLPSRINSTWGGNLTDMVRATHYLRIIEQERLVENARLLGELFLAELRELAVEYPLLTAARGRGLMLAFDLPDRAARDAFWRGLYELGLLTLRGGERTIRFRPALDIRAGDVARALELLREQCRRMVPAPAGTPPPSRPDFVRGNLELPLAA